MSYTLEDWMQAVDRCLRQRNRGVTCAGLDPDEVVKAFSDGVSPVVFAAQPQLPMPPPPPPPAPVVDQHKVNLAQAAAEARARQVAAVLEDPRYLVDTGHDVACPTCGSTNVAPLGKPGTGFGAIGSIGFVVAATLVEAAVQKVQRTVYQCTYCLNKFQ
jgi:DNA-directed RNA polymerase subunit RPC12/RpoP